MPGVLKLVIDAARSGKMKHFVYVSVIHQDIDNLLSHRSASYTAVNGKCLLTKTVIHKKISSEELGGTGVHMTRSGVAHFT